MEDLLIKAATVIAVALATFSSFPTPAPQQNQHQPQTSIALEQDPPVPSAARSLSEARTLPQQEPVAAAQLPVKETGSRSSRQGNTMTKESKPVAPITNMRRGENGKENSQIER